MPFFAASQAAFRVGPALALLVESLACRDRERLEADYAFLRDHLYTGGRLSMLCVLFFVFLTAGGTARWCRRLAAEIFFVRELFRC